MSHFLDLVNGQTHLLIPTVWDVQSATASRDAGAEALFLSGSALAGTRGFPDLGLVSREQLVDAAKAIVQNVGLPLFVDIDDGFGSPVRLGALSEMLADVGVAAVMIEDIEYPGAGALCDPDVMLSRIRVIRDAAGDRLRILARTDVLRRPWDFEETLRRVRAYHASEADWVIVEGIASIQELHAVAAIAAPSAFASAESRTAPRVEEIFAAGFSAAILDAHVSEYRSLRAMYTAALAGDDPTILDGSGPWRDGLKDADRYGRWIDLGRVGERLDQ